MFQRFHKMREEREGGFTLIELLVVILIIAILAAIAIPVFLAQRKKGWNGQVQSALKNAATAAESHATDNNGSYAGLNNTDETGPLADEGYKGAADVSLTVTGDSQSYCIVAVHSGGLEAGDDWHTASYSSENGEPTDANSCA